MIPTRAEAEKILQKALSFAKADETQVGLFGGDAGNTRFALNGVTTSGHSSGITLYVSSAYGKKSGTATINEFDDGAIERCVRAAEEIARLAPEDPEAMPALGPQKYIEVNNAFIDATAEADPLWRAKAVAQVLEPCKAKNLTSAGFIEHSANVQATANSKGLFAYHKNTLSSYTVTVRTADGTGSGWAADVAVDATKLNTQKVADVAVWKSENSPKPVAVEPGRYTVILEPAAVADLIAFMLFNFQARAADEGRNFLAKEGGKTRVGDKIFGDKINIYTDPQHPLVPGTPFDGEGLPARKMDFVKDGVVTNLVYSRFWAQKQGKEPTPFPSNVVMAGGDKSLDQLIAETDRGILVTRLWYIRELNPQTLLQTGLTRDATFLVEKGKIKHPIKNMRFNHSPVEMLNNIEAMGAPVRGYGSEVETFPIVVPALRVSNFNFSSLSDAV